MPVMYMPWGRMAYLDSGSAGTPALFLHGTGCDAGDWRDVLDALTVPCRAIALDFRAHGGSDVPAVPFSLGDLAADALALLAHLDLPAALWVGHSLGGMVALEAARRSAAVAGLVLLEGWTSLRAARAFVEPRFYGQLGGEAIARIQRKDRETRDRVPAPIWRAFWQSVEAFDAGPWLAHATLPVIEVYGAAVSDPRPAQHRLAVDRGGGALYPARSAPGCGPGVRGRAARGAGGSLDRAILRFLLKWCTISLVGRWLRRTHRSRR